MEITNKEEFKTINWVIEHDGNEYGVTMVENHILDDWRVLDFESGEEIPGGNDLWRELVAFCQTDLENGE